MTRAIDEWVGKTDDTAPPPRVKLRVFDRANGRCESPGCGRKIDTRSGWQADHVLALVNGGANKESNLQCLCGPCHKLKTRVDVHEKATTYRKRLKYLGLKKSKNPMQGSKNSKYRKRMDGTVEER